MSDAHAHETPASAAASGELFDKQELLEFTEDDVTAGRNIGKMLSILFIYTLIAMSIASTWTYFSTHR